MSAKMTFSPFTLLGVTLVLVGAVLSFTSYFLLNSILLTALGLSALILAVVSFALGRGQPKISDYVSNMLLESGLANMAALIEALGLGSKAIYLPPSMAAGRSCTLLPVSPGELQKIQLQLPDRLIVRYGQEPEEMGILVSTLGSVMVERYMGELTGAGLESNLSSVLKQLTDLADGLRAVEDGGTINVEITNSRIEYKNMQIFENIGSPLASVVASVVSMSIDKPITILREDVNGNKHMVTLKAVR